MISPGTPVELEQWGGGKPLAAKVKLVEPAAFTKFSALGVEEQRVNVVVDILAPVNERLALGDNFRVEGRIVTAQSARTLKVPTGALFRRGTDWAAFAIDNGRARLKTVTTGSRSAVETEVLVGAGLQGPDDGTSLRPVRQLERGPDTDRGSAETHRVAERIRRVISPEPLGTPEGEVPHDQIYHRR